MTKNIAFIAVFLLIPSLVYAAPSVSGVGTVVDGGSVVISGSSFGSKSTAAPIKYDGFEGGVIDADIESTSYWTKHNVDDVIIFDDGNVHSGAQAAKARYDEDEGNGWFHSTSAGITDKMLVSFWAMVDVADQGEAWQQKTWRINSTGEHGSAPSVICQYWYDQVDPLESRAYYEIRKSDSSAIATSVVIDNDPYDLQWVHFMVLWDQSTVDTANGSVAIYYDDGIHTIQIDAYSNIVTLVSGSDTNLQILNLGYEATNYEGGSMTPVFTYFDDVYIDDSWAHVEIGDNATYNSCTHREMQIPSAWADGEITVTVKQGSFSNGSAYLFVVDAAGAVSDGYEITFTDQIPTISGCDISGVDIQ
jgi:hypothetical protein